MVRQGARSSKRSAERVVWIWPHQLFVKHPALDEPGQTVFLAEDPLLFVDRHHPLSPHFQKLVLLRAAAKRYEAHLARRHRVRYLEAPELADGTTSLVKVLDGVRSIVAVDPVDDLAERRLERAAEQVGAELEWLESPAFLTTRPELDAFFGAKPPPHQFLPFYTWQRKRLGFMVDVAGRPEGGKWTYDTENRKKLPKGIALPAFPRFPTDPFVEEAVASVERDFSGKTIGRRGPPLLPTSAEDAERLLEHFLDQAYRDFGPYEDAIQREETFLFHSALSSSMNLGLLSPARVVEAALSRRRGVPLPSVEGFVRQVIGWREYVRALYVRIGRRQRRGNFFEHHHPMPASLYDGTTGIVPVDTVVRRLLDGAYCHHIERLMVLGSFFFLVEIEPNAIYRWFSEFFIDAFDWVMVPNVYGMSQYADGGLMTTKPYFGASNYILKMSDHRRGPWCEILDALFWRKIARHKEFFAGQNRLGMLVKQLPRHPPEQLALAENFLEQLHRLRTGASSTATV